MFVIDRIKLVVIHQLHQMRKLHGDDTGSSKNYFHAFNEINDIRNMGQDVISKQQICLLRPSDLPGDWPAPCQKLDDSLDTFSHRNFCCISSWLNSHNGNILFFKVLQKIAVITCYFNYLRCGIKFETPDHHVGIFPCMPKPGCGIRREVGVLIIEYSTRFLYSSI